MCGTPEYIAPEMIQMLGHDRCDNADSALNKLFLRTSIFGYRRTPIQAVYMIEAHVQGPLVIAAGLCNTEGYKTGC